METKYYRGLSDHEKQTLREGIFRRLKLSAPADRSPRAIWKTSLWVGVAASFVIIVGGILFYNGMDHRISNGKLMVQTGANELKKIRLSDSTVVILNANSSLVYNSDLTTGPREVKLTGNAFFQVKKDISLRHFIVHAGALAVTVTGTQFNVNARTPEVEVALASGKVEVNFDGYQENKRYMIPGDKLKADPSGRSFLSGKIDASIYSAWTRGVWDFRNTSLEDIASFMEEYYDVRCIFKDARKKDLSITGVIPVNTVQGLIQVISETLQINIKQTDNQVFIQ